MTDSHMKPENEIKAALLDHLLMQGDVDLVLSEFVVGDGTRRADILALRGDFFDAYEIKSASDRLTRLGAQISYYSSHFDRVTAVVTSNHLAKTLEICPSATGIIEFCKNLGKPNIKIIRKGRTRRQANNTAISSMMSVNDLRLSLRKNGIKCSNLKRATLRELFAELSQRDARTSFREALFRRYARSYEEFLARRGDGSTRADMLQILSPYRLGEAKPADPSDCIMKIDPQDTATTFYRYWHSRFGEPFGPVPGDVQDLVKCLSGRQV